jgi:hypothetical protein
MSVFALYPVDPLSMAKLRGCATNLLSSSRKMSIMCCSSRTGSKIETNSFIFMNAFCSSARIKISESESKSTHNVKETNT